MVLQKEILGNVGLVQFCELMMEVGYASWQNVMLAIITEFVCLIYFVNKVSEEKMDELIKERNKEPYNLRVCMIHDWMKKYKNMMCVLPQLIWSGRMML